MRRDALESIDVDALENDFFLATEEEPMDDAVNRFLAAREQNCKSERNNVDLRHHLYLGKQNFVDELARKFGVTHLTDLSMRSLVGYVQSCSDGMEYRYFRERLWALGKFIEYYVAIGDLEPELLTAIQTVTLVDPWCGSGKTEMIW